MHELILPALNIAVMVLIFYISQPNRDNGFFPYEFFNDTRFLSGRRDTVYLVWSAGCGYCQKLKADVWPQFVERAKTEGITIREIEMKPAMSKEDQDLLRQVGPIPGVPYIFKFNGRVDPYQGPRQVEDILRWASSR